MLHQVLDPFGIVHADEGGVGEHWEHRLVGWWEDVVGLYIHHDELNEPVGYPLICCHVRQLVGIGDRLIGAMDADTGISNQNMTHIDLNLEELYVVANAVD